MIKVRYHLQQGQHYKHWQFKDTKTKEIWYVRPSSENIFELTNCVLHNNRNVADKIYMGANKDVCAWIKCKGVTYYDSDIPSWYTHLKYNPRKLPYWHTWSGRNIDGLAFDTLYLTPKGVYYNECRNGILNPLKVMT